MSQVLMNALVTASTYGLVGGGFFLVWRTGRFFHIAHGIVLTIGAYTTFVMRTRVGIPLAMAVLCGICVCALIGAVMDWCVYRPLRRRGASADVLLLASLGIYVSLQAVLIMVFGAGTQSFRNGYVPESLSILGTRVTQPQLIAIVSAAGSLFALWTFLSRTRLGLQIRAVADDPELAAAYGLDRDRLCLVSGVIASALAAIAGILMAWSADMTPMLGFSAVLMGVVVMVIGGLGGIGGLAGGGAVVALLQHLTSWWISTRWQETIVFLLLTGVLLLRANPMGSASQREATR
jgi:branched-chain amino acid transport system permease protein